MIADIKLFLLLFYLHYLLAENSRVANELSEVKHRYEEQHSALEKKSSELEKQVTELTFDLSKVNSDLRDSSANYELRIETLETKLKSSNECLQVRGLNIMIFTVC